MIPAKFPGLLGADPDREAQHDIGVKPGLPGRFKKRERLLKSQRPAGPPDRTLRRVDERSHIPPHAVVRLGVPDCPRERSLGDLQVPGRQPAAERLEPGAHIPSRQLLQRLGADLPHERRQGLLVDGSRALRPARQPAFEPVVYCLPDRVGRRGAQAAVKLGVQRLELVPHVLLGAAGDLAPDPLPVRPEASETAPTYRFFASSK